jgi:transcription elongation factor Elf1
MNQNQPLSPPNGSPQKSMTSPVCKHPRVQIVAREEDAEYVECKECGEVFESSEFKDMAIEENTPAEEA